MEGRPQRFWRWCSTHRPTVVVLTGLVALTALSTAVWVTASSGSKEADLGSSLFSGLVVGAALLVVGKMFDATARQGQSNVALQQIPDSTPDEDDIETAPPVPTPSDVTIPTEPVRNRMKAPDLEQLVGRRFEVVYEGSQRDTSRLDAQQIRLRLFELVPYESMPVYMQFVTIPVPSPELRRFVGSDASVTEGKLWWHIARSVADQLRDAIQREEIPLSKRSAAYEVAAYDLSSAVKAARQDSAPSHEVRPNQVIYRFDIASTHDNLYLMQMRQILGYDAQRSFNKVGPNRYIVELTRPLTPVEEHRLEELASNYRIHVQFRFVDQTWDVGSSA